MEQVTGIEPACSAWEADILPLNYTRKYFLHYSAPKLKLQGANSLLIRHVGLYFQVDRGHLLIK